MRVCVSMNRSIVIPPCGACTSQEKLMVGSPKGPLLGVTELPCERLQTEGWIIQQCRVMIGHHQKNLAPIAWPYSQSRCPCRLRFVRKAHAFRAAVRILESCCSTPR